MEQTGTTRSDLQMRQWQEAGLRGPLPLRLWISQPSKPLAKLAEQAYRQPEVVLDALAGVWEPNETPLVGGLADARNDAAFRVAWARWWAHHGFNVFRLDEATFARLALTDPPDLPIEELRLPYNAIRLEIPSGFLPIASEEGRTHYVRWLDIGYFPSSKGPKSLLPLTAARALRAVLRVGDEPPAAGIRFDGRWVLWARCPDLAVGGTLNTLQAAKGITLHDFVHGNTAAVRLAFDMEEEAASLVSAVRVVTNFCLALDAQVLHPQQRVNRRKQKRSQVARPTVFVFDKSDVDMCLLESAQAVGHGKNAALEWKVKSRFIVRGHWRNQACGPGMHERKRIFIEPYWKGPDTADGYAHLYKTDR